MFDFEKHENAVAVFRESQQFSANPLVSADFHFQNLSDFLTYKVDFNNLLEIAKREKWQDLEALPFGSHHETILVTTPQLQIVFSTSNLLQMNGFYPEEVIGHSPKIFQGDKTDGSTLEKIANSIRDREPFEHIILNYRKDGSRYDCHIKGFPLFDKQGNLKHFLAIEKAA